LAEADTEDSVVDMEVAGLAKDSVVDMEVAGLAKDSASVIYLVQYR
jgi:hypothetical protein